MDDVGLIKIVKREIKRYTDTVRILFSSSQFFRNNGVEIDIEPTIKTISSNKRPDIVIYEKGEPKIIADYKWSLKRKEEYIVKELNDVYEKYSCPQLNDKVLNVDVIALIPDTDQENVVKIINKINEKLIIYSIYIYINDDEGYIEFREIKGRPNYEKFVDILEKHGYKIPLNRYILTRIAFIREGPPPPYNAYIIWRTIYHLASVNELYFKKEVELEYNDVLDELKRQFPPWVREDINQLTEGRLNQAIKFLNELGFLKIDKDKSKIIVNLRRGSKVHDQSLTSVCNFIFSNIFSIERNNNKAT